MNAWYDERVIAGYNMVDLLHVKTENDGNAREDETICCSMGWVWK
jgi:hypothetical protein